MSFVFDAVWRDGHKSQSVQGKIYFLCPFYILMTHAIDRSDFMTGRDHQMLSLAMYRSFSMDWSRTELLSQRNISWTNKTTGARCIHHLNCAIASQVIHNHSPSSSTFFRTCAPMRPVQPTELVSMKHCFMLYPSRLHSTHCDLFVKLSLFDVRLANATPFTLLWAAAFDRNLDNDSDFIQSAVNADQWAPSAKAYAVGEGGVCAASWCS